MNQQALHHLNRTKSPIFSLTSYPAHLPKRFKLALSGVTLLTVIVTILDGLGLALIIPLVELLIGLDSSASSTSIVRWASTALEWLGFEQSVGLLVAVILVIQTARVIGMALQIWLNSLLKVRFEQQLRSEAYNLILGASWLHITSKKSGDLYNVLISQSQRAGDTLSSYGAALAAVITTVIYLIAAILISWNLSLLAAAYTVGIILALSVFLKFSRRLGRNTANTVGEISVEVNETIGGMKAIKASALEDQSSERFTGLTRRLARYASLYGLSQGTMNSAAEAFFLVAMLLGLVFASTTLALPAGALLLFALLFFRMFQRAKGFQQSMLEFFQVEPALALVRNAQQEARESNERSGGSDFESLGKGVNLVATSFKYPERTTGIDNISIEIKTGQSTAIVGSSGAGKTTIIDLVVGLIEPDSGEVVVGNEPLSTLSLKSWRSRLSYVTQGTTLFNDTIARNIAPGREEVDTELLNQVCTQSGVDQFFDILQNGYETPVGDRGVRLSGGQRQRIALARALYRKPQLLILDEATSELDGASERMFQETIDKLHGDTTILIVAHRLSTVMNVDYLYVLDNGTIQEHGKPSDLIVSRGVFYSMLNDAADAPNRN